MCMLHLSKYPLPTIDEVRTRVGNACYFSKIDLCSAFLQVPLDEKSKVFTTINTPEGLFEYQYLPMGTSCSPALFQELLCRILDGIDNCVIYQDDILLMSATEDEHIELLENVLNTLKAAGIKINRSKCDFFTKEVEYLGHVFDSSGMHRDSSKLKAIMDAPVPTNLKELQSFIGLANYYNRYYREQKFVPRAVCDTRMSLL